MSFFRMGRQPDTFALVVGFEGYVVSEGNAPGGGVLELHQARVEWDGDARGEDVLVKLRDAERGLPFDVTGDVVRVRLGVDEYAIDGHGEHVSQTNQGEHKRTDSGSILGTMFAGVGSAGNLASFLIGGDSSRDETNEATGSTTSRSGKPPVVPGGANNGAPKLPVTFNFSIEKNRATPRFLQLTRPQSSGSDQLPESVYTVLRGIALHEVFSISLKEGVTRVLLDLTPNALPSLRTIDLSESQLCEIPESVFEHAKLTALVLNDNKLTSLPCLARLTNLKQLSANGNGIRELRQDLKLNANLRTLSLENNKLTKPVIDFKALAKVNSLRLLGNPIDFLPEMHHALELTELTLFNVRIVCQTGSRDLLKTTVAVDETSGSTLSSLVGVGTAAGRGVAGTGRVYEQFFSLVFRGSACQHPLIARAIAIVATRNLANCEQMASTKEGVPQLLSMVLSNDWRVVRDASAALGALAEDASLAKRLVEHTTVTRVHALLSETSKPDVQICGLTILSNLSFASDHIARQVFGETLLDKLIRVVREGTREVQCAGLEALGNLSFEPANRAVVSRYARSLLQGYALGNAADEPSIKEGKVIYGAPVSPMKGRKLSNEFFGNENEHKKVCHPEVKRAATRALAILGENELVRRATGRRPVGPKGVRILCMDGGGIRGIATIQMLRRLELGTGRKIHELFDLICGTSTGGILAMAVGVHNHSLDRCESIYNDLGAQIFSKPKAIKAADGQGETPGGAGDPGSGQSNSWSDRIGNLYTSAGTSVQQAMRLGLTFAKHDAGLFETLVKRECALPTPSDPAGKKETSFVDVGALGGPKVFVVSTLVSVIPATPFLFRNYQYPPCEIDGLVRVTPPGVGVSANEQTNYIGTSTNYAGTGTDTDQKAPHRSEQIPGSCKHRLWQGVRASSAAPYYLADYSFGHDKFQDGAVTCNNPGMLAVMEARRLWPDANIDVVVSLGSGVFQRRQRDASSTLAGGRLNDLQKVVLESCCSVDRVDESLRTLLPLVPGAQYFRFNPTDARCEIELDATDLNQLRGLTDATNEYVETRDARFAEACLALGNGSVGRNGQSNANRNAKTEANDDTLAKAEMGSRRGMLLVEAPRVAGDTTNSANAVSRFCALRNIPFQRLDVTKEVGALGTGKQYEQTTAERNGETADAKPSEGIQTILRTASKRSGQIGVVHFECCRDLEGLVLRWAPEIVAVAEPSQAAEAFVAGVAGNKESISSIHELCFSFQTFEVNGVLHEVLGEHAQTVTRDEGEKTKTSQKIGAYLFRKHVPAERLDVNACVSALGVWREKIVCSSTAMPLSVIEAVLDAEAKVVVAPDAVSVSEDADVGASSESLRPDDVAQFFTAFYHALYVVGADAVAALGAAALVQPRCKRFRCHMRIDGKLVVLKAGDDDLLPDE